MIEPSEPLNITPISPGFLYTEFAKKQHPAELLDTIEKIAAFGKALAPLLQTEWSRLPYGEGCIKLDSLPKKQLYDPPPTHKIPYTTPPDKEWSVFWSEKRTINYLLQHYKNPYFTLGVQRDEYGNFISWFLGYSIDPTEAGLNINDEEGNQITSAFYLDTAGIFPQHRTKTNKFKSFILLDNLLRSINDVCGFPVVITRIHRDARTIASSMGLLGFAPATSSSIDEKRHYYIKPPSKQALYRNYDNTFSLAQRGTKVFGTEIEPSHIRKLEHTLTKFAGSVLSRVEPLPITSRLIAAAMQQNRKYPNQLTEHEQEFLHSEQVFTQVKQVVHDSEREILLLGPLSATLIHLLTLCLARPYYPSVALYEHIPGLGGTSSLARYLFYTIKSIRFSMDEPSPKRRVLNTLLLPPLTFGDGGWLRIPLLNMLLQRDHPQLSRIVSGLYIDPIVKTVRNCCSNHKENTTS